MPLFKKIAFYLFLATSLAAGVWGYFNLKESKAPSATVTEHISAEALCVIETKNVHDLILQLTRQNLIWNSLLSEEVFSNAQNGIRYLDSLTKAHADISEVIENNAVYWSFIKDGEKTESLIQFKLKEQKDEGKFDEFFNTVFVKNTTVSSFIAYDLEINKKKWLACCINGVVYFCSDLSLLQKSIELPKTASLADNTIYNDLLKLNGRQKTRVYLNHALSGLLNTTLFKKQSMFSLEIELNELTCIGYTKSDPASVLSLLPSQQPAEMKEFQKLPDHVASLTSVAVSNAELFYKESLKILPGNLAQKNEQLWKAINDSALYNLRSETYDNVDGEMVLANYWLDDNACQIIQIKIQEEDKATQLLNIIDDSIKTVGNLKMHQLNQAYVNLFTFSGHVKEMRYACVVSGNVVFISDDKMLEHYVRSIENSALLGKNVEFMNYANDNLFQSCNYIYYENYDQMKLSTFPRLINSIELNTGNDVLSHFSLSISSYKADLQIRLHGTHKQEQAEQQGNKQVLWSFTADSVISNNSYVFKNHITQENELCFQDEANVLYLVNSTGNALWRKEINETIRSAVYTVDLFKNGKFQMLFNTDHYLHLIDRNGNYVQGYPVRLPQKVTSGITLLDYDNTKDYRIFVACADKKIYNFSLYGIKTEGFVPFRTDSEVKLPVVYAKVGASDYLITADVDGKIYAFSRKGEGRIDFKNKVIEGLEHLYVSAGNNLDNTKLIYVDDKNNLLNKISLSDKKEALKLGDELNGFQATFALVNEDKQMDLITFGDGAIYAYDLFSGKLVESFNSQVVYKDASLAYTESNRYIIGFDNAGQKADVVDLTGKIVYSIPGITHKPLVTELYKDGKKYLIGIQHNRINCIRLN